MDGNNWYQGYQQQGPPTDPVHDAHRLLAVYPMASATPTTHVARHLGSLSLTAPVPSYIQPQYYSLQHQQHGNPPPYTEYAPEINYLSSAQPPVNDSGYWENTRDEAVRLIGNQPSSYTRYAPPQWAQQPTPSSSANAFAQSVFQRTAPASAYPTPPPAPTPTSTSYSSLAFALGNPSQPPPRPSQSHSHSPPKQPIQSQQQTYTPEDSASFFDAYLAQKAHEIDISTNTSSNANIRPSPSSLRFLAPQLSPSHFHPQQRPVTPPQHHHQQQQQQESPDPLALIPAPSTTPQKRKSATQLHSPSLKRVHSSVSTPSRRTASQGSEVTPRKSQTVYVELPVVPKSWKTPTSSHSLKGKRRHDNDDDDLGGYGSEDDEDEYRQRQQSHVKTSARRTGDRDERAPLEKLTALFEDIFEAEDSLPADTDTLDPSSLPPDFFSPLTSDLSRPLLHPTVIRKLTKYIGHVSRPVRGGASGGTPKRKGKGSGGWVGDVDVGVLGRMLKILERSVRAGEDLDPFVLESSRPAVGASREKTASPRKPKKPNSTRKSKTPTPHATDERDGTPMVVEEGEAREVTEVELDRLGRTLEVARDSILAAECCIALLGSDRLPKQLYSEELITACLSTIKNQLTKLIYPFVEASSSQSPTHPPLLSHLLASTPTSKDALHTLSSTFQAVSAVLPRITNLVCAELVVMSDSIIIQAVYIAIGPFFVVQGADAGAEGKGKGAKKGGREDVVVGALGSSAMRGLRLDALSLIRNIFANHEDQRSWIIEEILSSLIKLSDTKQKAGQFRLRDGRSIRTVSALLLQLVQTSAHDVRIEASKIDKARQQIFALRRQESVSEHEKKGKGKEEGEQPFLDEHDQEEIRLYLTGLESATKAAKTIILFLTQRSGKSKSTKNSNETEYRSIFVNLISDLLAVLYWPEWPAASLLLGIACKFMVSSLDDVKTTQTDNNAVKTIALEHLGVIAARIRSSVLKVKQGGAEGKRGDVALKPLDEMLSSSDIKELDKLLITHQDVATHLCKRSSEDQAYDSARELTAVTWGQELATALKQVNAWITEPDSEDFDTMVVRKNLVPFGKKLKAALRNVWKDRATDVFDIGSQEEVVRIDRLAEEIGTIQSLRSSFHPILNVILAAADAPPVFMRNKALRALGQIVTSDPTILSAANVRRAFESHLLDSSSAVREAAVELIGKYMIDSPEVAGDYYQKIAERIADTGLGVRKRVIKLLKSFYSVTEDNNRRIDIGTRIVLRMLDEDDTVKDLAVKTMEELWFQTTPQPASILKMRTQVQATNPHDKGPLLLKVAVVMGVSANFKDRQSPLEDMLHKIMAEKEGPEAVALHARYAEICETLIDGLVDASDLPGFTVINCVRTIYLFTSAYPAILSGTHASTLLPYLKNATSAEEQATSDYLLKIFRSSVPHMPKTAAKFGIELQLSLQPMVLKPSTAGGVMALQETVACMCTVVQHLTHDFIRLVALVKSCNGRLQQAIARPVAQKMTPVEIRGLSILIFIVSLLGEHCDFDRLRIENESLASDLNAISKVLHSASIIEHIYYSLLKLYEKYDDPGLRGRILQCLGFLFRAQPTLMTLERSATIMDAIFASPEEEGRGRLLRIMQEFLMSEAAKHAAKEKESVKGKSKAVEVNMEELVGNTDGFADSGVSSAVVQRYLNPILQAALSQNPQIQAAAIDVLSFTIKQGLAHPLQSFPIIVALETSPNTALSGRASALHAVLHSKHASLLNARYTISAKESFDYQKKLASGAVHGYRMQPSPTALMQRWYSLVREKRASRQDFLKSLVKVFDVNIGLKSSQDELDFIRYMAENFSAFDYKTQEEVFTVIKYLTSVLSTAGMQLVEVLSPSHLLSQLRGSTSLQAPQENLMHVEGSQPASSPQAAISQPAPENMPLMRCSVVIGMVMLLKAYLKTLYGVSEEKCSKFVVGKKSTIGDRPASRRHENPISWDRLPFAKAPLLTTQDMNVQKTRFLEVWNEDGLTAEPEDEFAS